MSIPDLLDTNHYSIPSARLGDDEELWHQRVHDTLCYFDQYYWTPGGYNRKASPTLHIAPEFTRPPDHEPNETFTVDERRPLCDRYLTGVKSFKAKPANVYPPLSRDICGYCMYEFVRWWWVQANYAHDDERPPELVDDE